MKPKTIEEFWQDYKKVIYPEGINFDQHRQVRQSFLAGFSTMFMILEILSDSRISNEKAIEILEFYSQDHKKEVKKQITQGEVN